MVRVQLGLRAQIRRPEVGKSAREVGSTTLSLDLNTEMESTVLITLDTPPHPLRMSGSAPRYP